MPKDFPIAPQIFVIVKKTEEKTPKKDTAKTLKPAQRRIINYSDEDAKIYHGVQEDSDTNKKPKEAYQPWAKEQDDLLKRLYQKGMSMTDLSKQFNRTKGAIWSRVKKLGIDVM